MSDTEKNIVATYKPTWEQCNDPILIHSKWYWLCGWVLCLLSIINICSDGWLKNNCFIAYILYCPFNVVCVIALTDFHELLAVFISRTWGNGNQQFRLIVGVLLHMLSHFQEKWKTTWNRANNLIVSCNIILMLEFIWMISFMNNDNQSL